MKLTIEGSGQRIRQGVKLGLFFACFYSVYVVGVYLVRGSAPFERLGTTIVAVVSTYFVTGAAAGGFVGFLRPMGRTLFGAMLIAAVGAFCVFFGIAVATDGLPNRWTGEQWSLLLTLPMFFGAVIGYSFWKNPIP